jgi:hypothetical protein
VEPQSIPAGDDTTTPEAGEVAWVMTVSVRYGPASTVVPESELVPASG